MNDKKVKVISTANAIVGMTIPEYHFSRTWAKKGAQVLIDKDMLEEALARPGVQYLFEQGLLYIEDMETKKDLGLEPLDAKEPTNIIIPDDKVVKRLLTVAPVSELKAYLKKLPAEQISEFGAKAVALKDISLERSDAIKEVAASYGLNIDVAKSITLNKAAKEETKKK